MLICPIFYNLNLKKIIGKSASICYKIFNLSSCNYYAI